MAGKTHLPFDVVEAAIQVAGQAFHYKSGLKRLFLRAGVPPAMYERYEQEMKYVIARNVFADLDERSTAGYEIAVRIVQEMCSIRRIADPSVDAAAAKKAIERLKQLANATLISEAEDEVERKRRERLESERLSQLNFRQKTLGELLLKYGELLREANRQKAGYALEELLEDLFRAYELEYRPSYRAAAQQIDGAFKFEKFDYLLEVKWTQDEAGLEQLVAFKGKVDSKIQSTRGLFLSMNGFRADVVEVFHRGTSTNVILMDGHDLVLILEGRIELPDALELKTSKAAHEGTLYVPLRLHC
ncbi:MAG TPA: restriction endonuclease [Candidatus Sulfotelmatobacter sp.]|nr:restriction endonuclease [Candidatus Sulfotelmatobacter sp.]